MNAEIERRGGLALAGALLLLAAASPRLHAEGPAPVGLEAQGVDVRAALLGDLDVRDAYNRPVSREKVERQLAGATAAADPSARLSKLPLAETIWHLLNQILWGLGLRASLPVPWSTLEVPFEPSVPKPLVLAALMLLACAASVASSSISRMQEIPAFQPPRRFVLRC